MAWRVMQAGPGWSHVAAVAALPRLLLLVCYTAQILSQEGMACCAAFRPHFALPASRAPIPIPPCYAGMNQVQFLCCPF